MIKTEDFKTKAEITQWDFPKIVGVGNDPGKTVIALDIGYSGVKGASPNKVFCFPSYAKKATSALEAIGETNKFDIQLRNNVTKEIWLVGESAQAMLTVDDIESTTDSSLFTRYRYENDIFKVLAAAGLALGLRSTGAGNEIFLQSGLPAQYKDSDTGRITKAFEGHYDISLRVGSAEWEDYIFDLDKEHIDIMEQPQGTLCALAFENGEISTRGRDILKSNTIIWDFGFGTEDTFSIRAGYKGIHGTYTDTGMKAVFEQVIQELQQEYPDTNYKVFEFQNYLKDGKIRYVDLSVPGEIRDAFVDFSDALEKANRELCRKSVQRLLNDYSNLSGYKYLVVTGGTGESRFEQIKEQLSGLSRLTVLPGNLNTQSLAFFYSNVVGYYMFRYGKLAQKKKKVPAM